MKVLLLSGYRTSENQEDPLGVGRTPTGERLLDRQIHLLSQLGMEVICVLAGHSADEQLRLCPRIANTELVFDSNETTTLATNAKSGLAAAPGESCFIMPIEISIPPGDLWRALKQEGFKFKNTEACHVLQAINDGGSPWHYGFPLFVTPFGNRQIRELNQFVSLTDPRLLFHKVVFDTETDLAPIAKAS
ncbi:MAG: hypothetical protein AB7F86_01565 [Bdellovibrionales bacterium]